MKIKAPFRCDWLGKNLLVRGWQVILYSFRRNPYKDEYTWDYGVRFNPSKGRGDA